MAKEEQPPLMTFQNNLGFESLTSEPEAAWLLLTTTLSVYCCKRIRAFQDSLPRPIQSPDSFDAMMEASLVQW